MDSTADRPGRVGRVARRLAVAVVATLGLVYLGLSLLVADYLTRPRNRPETIDAHRVSPDATAWSVRTHDGLTLRGWYLPTRAHRRLLVLVHGKSGAWAEMADRGRDLHDLGYDVLLFDLRGHGRSDPARLTMGRRERDDLRAVLGWAERQGFEADRIGWLAQSMGASTVLMEAARNPKIRAAVLDSPYGDLPALLAEQLPRHSHLPRWFNPGILWAARLAFGARTDDLIPIRSARSWGRRPMLLIHGEADSIVPVGQSIRLARAAGPTCRAITLPGVEHVHAYEADPGRYVAAVDAFFRRHLRP